MSATATQLTECTATELLALYRARDASPVEVTQAVLKRIEQLNPALNAYVLPTPELALARADESDARIAKGDTWWQLQAHIVGRALALVVMGVFMVNAEEGSYHQASMALPMRATT